MNQSKFISPALFLIAALCFFLPFVSFTCQGQQIATVSGMELVTGTKIEKFSMEKFDTQKENSDMERQGELNSEPLAVAAFIFAILGIVISLIPAYSKILSVIIGAVGALTLLFLRSSIGGEAAGDLKLIGISYEWGYYLALLLFTAVFALNLYWKITENKSANYNLGDIHFHEGITCPYCGNLNSPGSIFCSKCGRSLTI